jgi:hypothetical protein
MMISRPSTVRRRVSWARGRRVRAPPDYRARRMVSTLVAVVVVVVVAGLWWL